MSPILFPIAAAHFFNDIYMGFLTPLYPIIMDKFSLSLSLVGAVSTGLLVSALGIAPSFTAFLVLLCLGCLGSAAFHPKGASVTPALSGSHPEVGMAVFSAGGNLGFAAGPAVIAFFISVWGFRATLVLAMLLRLVFINFCLTVGVRGLSTFLPVYMAQHGSRVTSIGALFTAMLALGALASVFVSTLSRRTGKRSLILVSAAAGAPLAVAGCLFFPSAAGIVLIVIAGTVLTFSNPLLILMAQKHSGDSPAIASSLIMLLGARRAGHGPAGHAR